MPVALPAIPDNVRTAFVEGLDDFLWKKPELVAKIKKFPGAIQGLPVYTLTLHNLQAREGAGPAIQAGWRLYFRGTKDEETVAGDIARILRDPAPTMTSLLQGERLAKAIDAAQSILDREEFQKSDGYEARLMRSPSLNVEVLWLKANAPGLIDQFFPIVSGLKFFSPLERFPLGDFFNLAEDIASRPEYANFQ